MAGTIKLTMGIQHEFGALKIPTDQRVDTSAQSTQREMSDTPLIDPTTPTPLDYDQVTSAGAGIIVLENLDALNYVDFGVVVSSTFYPVIRLLPGERFAWRHTPGVTLYGKANSLSVRCFQRIYSK